VEPYLKEKEIFFQADMTIYTLIESPCLVEKICAVFENI